MFVEQRAEVREQIVAEYDVVCGLAERCVDDRRLYKRTSRYQVRSGKPAR